MNIIIIGATGSTGLGLIDYLSAEGHKIYGTGTSKRGKDFFKRKNVEYISLDITNKESFDVLPHESIDCVVLLAGAMPARMKGYNPQAYIDVNITGTLNVAEYCKNNGIKKIIFSQSHSDVYGYWDTGEYIKHDAKRKLNLKGDHAMYIISKCAAVDILEHYYQEYGIVNIILRMPTIYCNWPASTYFVDGKKTDMAYMYFINRAMNGESIEVWGDPQTSKDIVYVKDFAQIISKSIISTHAQGIYNVGSGIATSLDQQIKGIIDVFSKPGKISKISYEPEKPSQVSYLYDISRTVDELGYSPKYTYHAMLQDMKQDVINSLGKNNDNKTAS